MLCGKYDHASATWFEIAEHARVGAPSNTGDGEGVGWRHVLHLRRNRRPVAHGSVAVDAARAATRNAACLVIVPFTANADKVVECTGSPDLGMAARKAAEIPQAAAFRAGLRAGDHGRRR